MTTPANQAPVFSLLPNVLGVAPTAANTKSDGTGTIGTDLFKVYLSGANGDWVSKIRVSLVASVASTLTNATVIRAFLTTLLTNVATTPNTNIWQLGELALAAATVDAPTSIAAVPLEIPLNMAIPPNTVLVVSTHAAPAANTSYQCLAVGGSF